ncbi:MAG: hypothetical protein LBK65_07365 [Tannerellaceae bacterium]|jgi:hypothetical protein|nr:hypothetical protein [Tannerellaceae bacterium]
MKIVYNNILPFKGFIAINLFGVLFVRGTSISFQTLHHEEIHTAQMKEMLYVFFYLFYVIEWLIRLFKYQSWAYYNISFEREAYANMSNSNYLKERKWYAWVKYL